MPTPTPPADDRRALLYRRIADDLHARIRAGEFGDGRLLPTEHRLCDQYGVSRITVRKALDLLVQAQLVLRRRGLGTIVRPTDPDRWTVSLSARLDEMVPPHRFVLVRQDSALPPADVATLAGWSVDERLRVYDATNHVASGEPLAHVRFYLPPSLAARITGAMIAGTLPLARQIERVARVRIDHAVQFVEPVLATGMAARQLRVAHGTALMRAVRVYRDAGRATVYAVDSAYHPHRYRMTARLDARPAHAGRGAPPGGAMQLS